MRIIKIDKDICITGDKPIILQDSICEIYSMIFYKTKEYESENDSREKEKKRKLENFRQSLPDNMRRIKNIMNRIIRFIRMPFEDLQKS